MIGCVKWFSFNFGCKVTAFFAHARIYIREKCVKIDTLIAEPALMGYKLPNFV